FDFFLILVMDLLHEFELGIWKALLIHLLQIIDSAKETSLAELDSCFHKVPSFGHDTIWHFHKNVSELKKLTV
ncbi:hypothetical protein HD554DRAFT_2024105, partial [Boletus coccyginus]